MTPKTYHHTDDADVDLGNPEILTVEEDDDDDGDDDVEIDI